jgi:hypothetical protein
VGLRLQRVPEEDDEVDRALRDLGADLLVSTERAALELDEAERSPRHGPFVRPLGVAVRRLESVLESLDKTGRSGRSEGYSGSGSKPHEPLSLRDVGPRRAKRERGFNNPGNLRNADVRPKERQLTEHRARH